MRTTSGTSRQRVTGNASRKQYHPPRVFLWAGGRNAKLVYLAQLGLLLLAVPVGAGTPPAVDGFLREGRIKEGLAAYASAANNAERFSLAVLQALSGLQHFSASMSTLGINPEFVQSGIPFLRVVVPKPGQLSKEPATPEKIAKAFQALRASLRQANTTLAGMSAEDFGVEINLGQVHLDLDGNGKVSPEETLTRSLGRILGIAAPVPPEADLIVRFDSADAMWLKAYTHLLTGMLDLLLAYDWRPVWDQCAHLVFLHPEPTPAITRFSAPLPGMSRWVDLIAAVHDMRLELVDKAGPRRAREQFRAMIASSRICWQRVLAETDNDREWLPSPKQTGPSGTKVSQGQVEGWQRVLDELEAVAAGKKLLPHWRVQEGTGINVDKLVASPPPLDLVLLIQGSALVPYLEAGPVSDRATWRNLMQPFGPGFARFAIWSN